MGGKSQLLFAHYVFEKVNRGIMPEFCLCIVPSKKLMEGKSRSVCGYNILQKENVL